MKQVKYLMLLFMAALLLPAVAQELPQLPMDAAVRYGKLPNGLTYYVRHNKLPENQAFFYIAQKVGSVQEEENQRGLAHFLEHMCFNGTEHFPGNGVVQYCERIGVKFGADLNAYTSTDETVYNIDNVPVSETNIDSCLLILRDWSDGLLLLPEEIDKERGVIHEEWRMRTSASSRMFFRNLPALYPGSRYGERYPIGLMSVVDNFKPQELRDYYEKWYRPDLQGIIVVGDIDVDQVESKIKALFSTIKMPENAAPYEFYPVPDNDKAIYLVDKDKEQTKGLLQLFFKTDPLPAEYRNTPIILQMNYMNSVVCSMLNSRINELAQKADCPFLQAAIYYDNYIMSKTKDALGVYILPKPGQDAAATQAVMQEVLRAGRFGFNKSELIRARDEYVNSLEKIYDNRDKQKSPFYISQYVRHFLEGNAIPDIETEFQIVKMLAQQCPVEVLNQYFQQLTASTDSNFVVLGMYPEKDDVKVPTPDELRAAVAAAVAAPLEAYVDNVKDEPLVPQLPAKGKIVKETAADFGYTCWTLSNGARVFYKKTDLNDSEVLFAARSMGGKSLMKAADYVNYSLMPGVIGNCGLGNFTSTELEKKLAGKMASCSFSLTEETECLDGSSTPKDLRTLFELIYLRFQAPVNDPDAYQNTMATLRTSLENKSKDPMSAFSDSVSCTILGHNPLARPLELADLEKADYEVMKRLYSERFAAGGDFDFFFTGNFDLDSLRTFTEQYIAPLKSVKQREKFIDRKISYVHGVNNNHFYRAMETPQAVIVQLWSGETPYTMKTAVMANIMGQILMQRYTKSIREEASLAYSVGAYGSADYGIRDEYSLVIQCPVKPAKLDSALLLMEREFNTIAQNGVTQDELEQMRKYELKDFADQQKKNGYWAGLIISKAVWGKDNYTGYEDTLNALKPADFQAFMRDVVVKQHNCTTISMRPEDMTE